MNEQTKCPKCGEKERYVFGNYKAYECDSLLFDSGGLEQSDRCRISELENENERLRGLNDRMTQFLGHSTLCGKRATGNWFGKCNCGYDELITDLRASALLQKKGTK